MTLPKSPLRVDQMNMKTSYNVGVSKKHTTLWEVLL